MIFTCTIDCPLKTVETFIDKNGNIFDFDILENSNRGIIFRRANLNEIINRRWRYKLSIKQLSIKNGFWLACRCDEFAKLLKEKGYNPII